MALTNITATTTELLEDLRNPANQSAWEILDSRMRPVILATALRIGLQREDAEEVAQQTMLEFLQGYRRDRYDRSKGRLRFWILGIARYTACDLLKRRGKFGGGEAAFDSLADENRLSIIWEEEWKHSIAREAITRLRATSQANGRTWRAFELYVLKGVPVPEVAAQCEMTEGQVYLAKTRIGKRLQETVNELTRAYEDDP